MKMGQKSKISCEEWKAFLGHRNGAMGQRGIPFKFTFSQWCAWWEDNLGPDWFSKRGRGVDKYVMARHGDKGPYAAWNVKCITHSENSKEQGKHNAKLTEEQVTIIYRTTYQRGQNNSKADLAHQFNVSKYTIKSIRKKETWRSVTDLLD